MSKRNAENERMKHRYLGYLKDAKGRDAGSIDAVAAALDRFDAFNRYRCFTAFHFEQARAFKANLMEARNVRTGNPLSASTIHATLAALKGFFTWLAFQPGYASRIKDSDVEYFSTPDKLSRVATARRFKRCPTLTQIRAMLDAMPKKTEIDKRDHALVAFTILSGARDGAIISFRLKHIDIERGMIEQDAREVRTKHAKTFTTWFFPVGDDIRQIVIAWIEFLRNEKGSDPMTRSFLRPRLQMATISCSVRCRLIASHGRTPTPCAASSERPAGERGCRISIRTRCGTRSFRSPMNRGSTPKRSRRGLKTSAMKAASRPFQATAPFHPVARRRLCDNLLRPGPQTNRMRLVKS